MVDPIGSANWSVMHVDWSKESSIQSILSTRCHFELPKNISRSISLSKIHTLECPDASKFFYHVTSDEKKVVTVKPCLWNGMKRLCYLFARKFYPEALHNLMQLFSNYTLIRDTSA
ncbi:unnamed protein product [Musa acuminata subsp. burmannicoides]